MKFKTLPAVRPSAAIEAAYQRQLRRMVREMHEDVLATVRKQFERTPPVMATDATPAKELDAAMNRMIERWEGRFDRMSKSLAKYFADDTYKQTTKRMQSILKKGGISVKFTMTKAQRDIVQASIAENVQLIKSIPQQYLGDVKGAVMRSVATGRDVSSLTKEIQKKYGITQRRAANIALDQNNKATSALNKARQLEVGLAKAVWKHSHGGRKPRPTHVKMDGKTYDIEKGMYDSAEGRYIQPGELIHCGCFSKSVLPWSKSA